MGPGNRAWRQLVNTAERIDVAAVSGSATHDDAACSQITCHYYYGTSKRAQYILQSAVIIATKQIHAINKMLHYDASISYVLSLIERDLSVTLPEHFTSIYRLACLSAVC